MILVHAWITNWNSKFNLTFLRWIQNMTDSLLFLFHYWNAVADPQSLLEEKEAIEEKLAISEYELRLAQEDILKYKAELQKKTEIPLDELSGNFSCLHNVFKWCSFVLFRQVFLYYVQLYGLSGFTPHCHYNIPHHCTQSEGFHAF